MLQVKSLGNLHSLCKIKCVTSIFLVKCYFFSSVHLAASLTCGNESWVALPHRFRWCLQREQSSSDHYFPCYFYILLMSPLAIRTAQHSSFFCFGSLHIVVWSYYRIGFFSLSDSHFYHVVMGSRIIHNLFFPYKVLRKARGAFTQRADFPSLLFFPVITCPCS